MDKLKYIKLENEDGSYSNSIPLAVDSDYVDINGDTLTNIISKKANTTDVNASISNLESEINSVASGSPAGVYSTVSALTTADPNHNKIYLVTENGHWYYYNNGWQDGGIYQAAEIITDKTLLIDDKAADAYITGKHIHDLLTIIEPGNLFDKSTVTSNSSLNQNTGNTFSVNGYYTSDWIIVKNNSNYKFLNNGELYVCQYDINKNYITGSFNQPSFTTENNTYYVRFANPNATLNNIIFYNTSNAIPENNIKAYINTRSIRNNSIENEKIKDFTLSLVKTDFVLEGKNKFNKEKISENCYLNANTGITFSVSGYWTSDYILISNYSSIAIQGVETVIVYDEDRNYIKNINNLLSQSKLTYEVSDGDTYVRFSSRNASINNVQLENGDSYTLVEPYKIIFDPSKISIKSEQENYNIPFHTLREAYMNWSVGNKFPIGFLGDSTTDGANTTGWSYETGHEHMDELAGGYGKADYINQKAYPYILENLIKNDLANNNVRIYNIGYSGTNFTWAIPKYDDIFGHVYSDVKMVGITYGINDRIGPSNKLNYYNTFKSNLIYTVKYLINKGIQPFLVTSQATIEPYATSSYGDSYPLRSSEAINTVANSVKFEIAKEYNLEIIDMTAFDEKILQYSNYSTNLITNDHLHFKDLGHKLEGYFLYSYINPRTVNIEDNAILDFCNQRNLSKIPDDKITYLNNDSHGFKTMTNYTKENSNDILIQDFWINNITNKRLTIKGYCTSVNSQYIIFDGEQIDVSNTEQLIDNAVDIGLHHIQVFSGETPNINWIGFDFTINE